MITGKMIICSNKGDFGVIFQLNMVNWTRVFVLPPDTLLMREKGRKKREKEYFQNIVFGWAGHLRVLGFPGGTSGKESACQCRRHERCSFDPWVGKIPWSGMAAHSSILAWSIPWTREPGRPQSLGSQRAGHDWSDLAHTHAPFSSPYCEDYIW